MVAVGVLLQKLSEKSSTRTFRDHRERTKGSMSLALHMKTSPCQYYNVLKPLPCYGVLSIIRWGRQSWCSFASCFSLLWSFSDQNSSDPTLPGTTTVILSYVPTITCKTTLHEFTAQTSYYSILLLCGSMNFFFLANCMLWLKIKGT